ncbi:hypothetical protein [Streptomyces sp. NPDC048172]|uniref:hypothetical protein n=1 Tax=Streptomyces sp. NPDC048172 TaxID=3365505 RepID=UPI00371E2C56
MNAANPAHAATRIPLHPLTFVPEPDGVMVGRADAAAYALLPEDGAALLGRLADGMPAREAAAWYEATYGETVDMADFVATLDELGFLRGEGDTAAAPPRVRLQALGRAVFSPWAWTCYALLALVCAFFLAVEPGVRPSAQHVFFSPSLIVVQLGLALVQVPLALLHEGFHALAGRRLGLPTRLGMGRRYFLPVFETSLDGLLGVERKKRYLPFLAGMLADAVMVCVFTALAGADLADGSLSWVGKLALAVCYVTLIRLAWQFYLCLRTDVYYVLATALGCTNVHEVASAYLRRRFPALARIPGVRLARLDESEWSPRDRAVAPWYSVILVGGVALLLAGALLVVGPVVLEFATRVVDGLGHASLSDARFWDSTVTLLLAVVQFAVLPLLAGRGPRTDSPAPNARNARKEQSA